MVNVVSCVFLHVPGCIVGQLLIPELPTHPDARRRIDLAVCRFWLELIHKSQKP